MPVFTQNIIFFNYFYFTLLTLVYNGCYNYWKHKKGNRGKARIREIMPEAIYNELSSRLEQYISEHGLTGKLPGLQKLAKILGANHITVRKAVELLVDRGRLEVIPSKGTFVCRKVPRLRNHRLIGVVGAFGSGYCREMLFERLNASVSDSGYKCMDIANNPRLFFANPRLLLQFPVDGYIFLGDSLNRSILETLMEDGIPVICTINSNFPEVNHVGMDHFDGYARVLKLLLRQGCRRIAFLDYERAGDFRNYIEDIRNVFISVLGTRFDPVLFATHDSAAYYRRYGESYHEAAAMETISAWSASPPDAVVTIPPMTSLLKRHFPSVTLVNFRDYSHQSACDIHAYADLSEVLRCAVKRMLELFDGDEELKEIRIPFIITQTERKQ